MTIHALPQSPTVIREGKSQRLPLSVLLAAVGVVLLLGVLMLALNMRRGLNHDEHQFIAGGALMTQGLLPYRDFAWFHMPGQGWVNALLFRFFDHLLLSARAVSIAAALGTLALLMAVALRRLENLAPWSRLGVATLILLLLVSAPGYWFAAGRAWNHDLAVLLALSAFCLLCRGLASVARSGASGLWWVGAAGMLLGAAISVRLTMAPLALPFLLAPVCWRLHGHALWRTMLALAAGMAAAMLPILAVFAADPNGFLFGNVRYASLNTLWYAQQDADVSLWAKMRAIALQMVQPGNLLLLVLTTTALVRARRAIAEVEAPELIFWLLAFPFVLAGAVAPTPMQVQYLFALFPFLALGLILALRHTPSVRWYIWMLAASVVVSGMLAAPRYAEGLEVLPTPSAWYPVKIHTRGTYLAQMMAAQAQPHPDDWAFTLSPILPLEGGVRIDTRTATGPFAWRIGELIDPRQRAEYGVLGAEDLAGVLAESPPRALLTAMHSDDERADDAAIEGWAQTHDYVSVPMPDEGTLWLSPLARWGEIRLGAQTFPTVAAAGETVHGTLYLQSESPTETNLNLLLRAVDVDGNELFRFDGWPFGSATSTWAPGALWQDGHSFPIPADATAANYRIELSFYDPSSFETAGEVATIGWLTVANDLSASTPLAHFGEIELLHAAPDMIEVKPGGQPEIDLVWRTASALPTDYTRFAHLLDEAGTLVAQADAQPLGGFYPTSQWRSGVPVFDHVDLTLPDRLPEGVYDLQIGLYDSATGVRLADAEGHDALTLRVTVGAAQ